MKRMSLTFIALVICTCLLIGLIGGCSPQATKPTDTTSTDTNNTNELFTVGVLWDFLSVEQRVIMRDRMLDVSEDYGFKMVFQNANGDENVQLKQAEDLITQGVDLIVLLPQNADVCGAIVEEAHKAGIEVFDYERVIPNADFDYFMGLDQIKTGELMAEYVYKLKPKGKYALISGASTDPNCLTYYEGWMNIIGDAVKNGDIQIVSDTHADNWDPANALKQTENFLTKNNDDIDVIMAMNDGLAGGVNEALEARGLAGKVLVTGQDGELAACQRIVEGKQSFTVYKQATEMADLLCMAISMILKGEEIKGLPDTEVLEIDNGFRKVPFMNMAPEVVDKDNMMDTIIASGYHKKEDVYANIPKDQWPK